MSIKIRKDPRQRLGSAKERDFAIITVRISYDEYKDIVDYCNQNKITLTHHVKSRCLINKSNQHANTISPGAT
jgi:hypothetical protein